MCCKRVLLHTAPPWNQHLFRVGSWCSPAGARQTARHDGLDVLWLLHNLLRHRALDTVTGDDDAVLVAGRPSFQKLAAHTVLQHTRTGQHDTAANILKPIKTLERPDEPKIPRSTTTGCVARGLGLSCTLGIQALDVIVHGARVCLVHHHALLGEVAGIVDGEILEIGVLAPVLVKNEEELLGTTKGKDRHQHTPATVENARNGLH